jgi:gliding-associated putative ABC transporter substrate-binding component GldG
LLTDRGRNQQLQAYEWPYFPVAAGDTLHPITKRTKDIKFEYTGFIDTLSSGADHHVLLSSSEQSKVTPLPAIISLDEINNPNNLLTQESGKLPLAVLTSGKLRSAFKNRVKPFNNPNHLDMATDTAQILLTADGDLIKNDIAKGRPLAMGYDKKTGIQYGNDEFIMNAVNYLMGDKAVLQLRNKDLNVPMIDLARASDNYVLYQLANILLPVLLILLIGLIFNLRRKRKYAG